MVEKTNIGNQEIEGKNLWVLTKASFDVAPGASIGNTINEAVRVAQRFGRNYSEEKGALISFEFNGIDVSVRRDSDPALVYRDWSRAINGYIDKNVGPYPNVELSEEEKERDSRIEIENEKRRQERSAEFATKEATKRKIVEAKLADAPEIELGDEEKWNKLKDNTEDLYSGAIISYSERWARLMQMELANGSNIEDIADSASDDADFEGITGFMYGAAVSLLSQVWSHGEDLRKWHNSKTQIGDEGEKANEIGGVLNPSVLRFGTNLT